MHGAEPNAAREVDVEVALLDSAGTIVSVNQAWTDFCLDNGGNPARAGVGMSYLAACASNDDDGCAQVRAAIELALAGQLSAPVTVVIECSAPDQPRWFDVLVSSRLHPEDGRCIGASVTISRSLASRRPTITTFPDETRDEMERLVAELTTRVHNVVSSQIRMHELLRVAPVLTEDPTLTAVLHQLAIAATELTGAKHAAVAVVRGTTIGELAHTGTDEELVALIREQSPQADYLQCVPINVRGKVVAHLYLSGDADLRLTAALAATASLGIDNALAHAEVQRRQHWQAIAVEAVRALVDPNSSAPLDVVAHYAAIGARGDISFVATLVQGEVRTEATSGDDAATFDSALQRLAGPVLRTGVPALVDDDAVLGSVIVARLLEGAEPIAVAVARLPGHDRFELTDRDQLGFFAAHTGIALRIASG